MIPEIEKATADEIKIFQEDKLEGLLTYLNTNSKYYKRIFKKHNIDITMIKTLEDLRKLPTTTKEDLQNIKTEFFGKNGKTKI